MKSNLCWAAALVCLAAPPEATVHLMTYDPGHFHAALVQKTMLPGVSPRVDVYAPLGPDLTAHIDRISRFNARTEDPTSWELEIHAGNDPLARMLAEKPGNVVVLSGRNRGKIEVIQKSLEAGLHVLADKPWIIESADMPKLAAALELAGRKRLVAYDIMTQRREISLVLARELASDREIFGDAKSARITSLHHILKRVAGAVNLRPAWFFDVNQQGEGLTDVGTHLVDLVSWTLFPDQAIDYRKEIEVRAGRHWPTPITLAQFQQVTGEAKFPEYVRPALKDGRLDYYCNNSVEYTIRGVPVEVEATWAFDGGADADFAAYQGSRARVEVRDGEVVVRGAMLSAVRKRVAKFAGVTAEEAGGEIKLNIPAALRVGHEAHFGMVAKDFFEYVKRPEEMPEWETPNMLAKYYVTTRGVELARK